MYQRQARLGLVIVLGGGWVLGAPLLQAEPPPQFPSASTPAAPATTSQPIDLLTALRLANAHNPTINVVRARVREAAAQLDRARLVWIPQLSFGPTFFYHDGIDQNRRGDTFIVSRGFYTFGAGPILRIDVSEALYLPLVARQNARGMRAQAEATTNQVQLQVALAYWDLVELHGRKAINADILNRTEQILAAAQAGAKAGVNKTAADVDRALSEVDIRRQEGIVLRGRIAAAAARLAQLLWLDPVVELVPYEPVVVPVVVVPGHLTVEQLVQIAFTTRPELAAGQAQVQAAEAFVRQSKAAPLLPRVQGEFLAGGLSGGINGQFGPFTSQYNAGVALIWNWEAFGAGNVAAIRARQANFEAAIYQLRALHAQVAAEVVEAAQTARAHFEALETAQEAVRQAEEMYRKFRATSFGVIGPQAQFDALEPLTAVQALNAARIQYLQQVMEFNRSQFRLYTAMGQPALTGWEVAQRQAVSVPTVPHLGEALPQPRPQNP